MKYTQNDRILQIIEKTLIVGIDVGSETHYARAFNFRGVEYGKVLIFKNDIQGFAKLQEWTDGLTKTEGFTSVTLGIEPTGHYWFNLAEHMIKRGMRAVLVNPHHVKKSKELDDNNPSKTDRKDPKTIAMLVKDGRYMEPYIPEGIYKELRTAMDIRWRLVQDLTAVKNRISRWLSIHFPEYGEVFGSWEGKASMLILHECPTPAKIVEKGIEGILAIWKGSKIRAVGRKRATRLLEYAEASIGTTEGLVAAERDLAMLLEDYERKMLQYENIMELV